MSVVRMTLGFLAVCLTMVGLPGTVRAADQIELGLITGGERGMYYQFGLDLQIHRIRSH